MKYCMTSILATIIGSRRCVCGLVTDVLKVLWSLGSLSTHDVFKVIRSFVKDSLVEVEVGG